MRSVRVIGLLLVALAGGGQAAVAAPDGPVGRYQPVAQPTGTTLRTLAESRDVSPAKGVYVSYPRLAQTWRKPVATRRCANGLPHATITLRG